MEREEVENFPQQLSVVVIRRSRPGYLKRVVESNGGVIFLLSWQHTSVLPKKIRILELAAGWLCLFRHRELIMGEA